MRPSRISPQGNQSFGFCLLMQSRSRDTPRCVEGRGGSRDSVFDRSRHHSQCATRLSTLIKLKPQSFHYTCEYFLMNLYMSFQIEACARLNTLGRQGSHLPILWNVTYKQLHCISRHNLDCTQPTLPTLIQ